MNDRAEKEKLVKELKELKDKVERRIEKFNRLNSRYKENKQKLYFLQLNLEAVNCVLSDPDYYK